MAKYDVFISYSRKDTAVADKICAAFDRAGISYFIDRQGIGGGMEFPAVLAEAIVESTLFLYLASMNSYESKFTTSEITFAFNEKPKNSLLPYIIDGSALPIAMKFIFSGINWRNTTDHPIETTLVDDICRLLGRERKATPQPSEDAETLYLEGKRLYDKKEYAAAIPFLTKAAEMGNVNAQKKLGYCYTTDRGVEKNYEEGVRWLRMAAENGDADVQNHLGMIYYYGFGVPADQNEALKWFRLAATQGHEDAIDMLNRLGESAEELFRKGIKYFNRKNYAAALPLLTKAAEQGYTDAMVKLGWMYEYEAGVKQNLAEAVKWYRRATEQGTDDVQCFLGYKASRLYKKMAENGNANAQYDLGWMYELGNGVSRNYSEAIHWYRKAAQKGHASAIKRLEELNEKKENPEDLFSEGMRYFNMKNYAAALPLLTKAAEHGYTDAMVKLGWMYEYEAGVKQNLAEAVKWYRRATEQGTNDVQCFLGYKASRLYKKMAENGNANAQYDLGWMYELGNGVSKKYSEAIHWYRKAAQQGHIPAIKRLEELGEGIKGTEGIESFSSADIPTLTKAAKEGNAIAQYYLGKCYYFGNGVTKDYYEASMWFRSAATSGNKNAQCALGDCYYYGNGVNRNYNKAVEWYLASAKQGNEEAIKKLERLGESV